MGLVERSCKASSEFHGLEVRRDDDLPGVETLLLTKIASDGRGLTATVLPGGELNGPAASVVDLAASVFALPRAGVPGFTLAVGARPVLGLEGIGLV